MLHEDHLGNRGDLRNGGVQWMTAGRGIIHSEMPQQEQGMMRGFQLWLNLPAAEKMKEAGYRDIQPEEIPRIILAGAEILLIAGTVEFDGQPRQGAVSGGTTEPLYADVKLEPGSQVTLPVGGHLNAFTYLYQGAVSIGEQALQAGAATVLDEGDEVTLSAGPDGAQVLLIAGKPLGEPVVQYGPFVMNSREEIEQTLRDYQSGQLTA